jgi:hypothetical protein
MATQAALISKLSTNHDRTKSKQQVRSNLKRSRMRKSDTLLKLVSRAKGAQMTDLQKATGWQAHSVRAGLTGLRKKGIRIDRIQSASGKTWYKAVEG